MEAKEARHVLIVEDDPGDVLLIEDALTELRPRVSWSVVGDGVDALAFLRKEAPYTDGQSPDLVLLDLNLPRVDGRQVLAAVKADAGLRHIPIVVLSTSGAADDIVGSYQLHANAYVTKPTDFDSFGEVIRRIEEFFVQTAKLPRV